MSKFIIWALLALALLCLLQEVQGRQQPSNRDDTDSGTLWSKLQALLLTRPPHKALLPLSHRDVAGFALSIFALFVAAGGGIGGGGLLCPVYILLLGGQPHHKQAVLLCMDDDK